MLSVAIIARDEQRHIGACLESLHTLADVVALETVVLLDSRSCDATGTIAAAHGARVYHEPWRGFPAQRNRALHLCRGGWVLFLDADERVTAELCHELAHLLQAQHAQPEAPASPVGYWIPRHNSFFGRVVRGGGWYPDRQLRLLRRGAAHYDEACLVHETARLAGTAGSLHGHLFHENIEHVQEFWQKQSRYAVEQARTLALAGRRFRWRNLAGAPARELWRRYVLLAGWRDGATGLVLCGSLAWFELVTFITLWLLQQGAAPRSNAAACQPPGKEAAPAPQQHQVGDEGDEGKGERGRPPQQQ